VSGVFDYVIAGGGSAGCVVAARLAEDPGCRVLLLEAGPDASAAALPRVPAASSRLLRGRYDWNFTTAAQERAGGRLLSWPRGKVLGGSSALGAMTYVRGNRADYDAWRDEYGCAGWGYRELLPYFLRAEDNERGPGPYHGAGGPLPVRDAPHRSLQAGQFIEAAVRRGAPPNDDFNGEQQDGVGFYQVTQRDGQRCTVAGAYLASRPENLTVLTGALVTGLLIEGGRAAGVTYRRGGRDETARAAAEVILSAGAVGTPQLLMLSGIGPADHLRQQGIYVIADMPAVGANLMDHPVVPVLWSTPRVKSLWESSGNRGLLRWRVTRKGPLTSNVAEAGGFARSDPRLAAPDLQWHVLPVAYRADGLTDPASRAMTVLAGLVDVASRGRVRLGSRDPRHRPVVDPGYLSDVSDVNALATGVRMARDYGTAAPLAKTCAAELSPGDGVRSDREVRDFIRRAVTSGHDAAGTCAMGGAVAKSASGYDSVTDPQLRVRGLAGLRVVDASVFPTLPRGDLNAAVIALAERAADLIAGRAPLVGQDPAAAPAAVFPAAR
jgi:choline dehydrogenase